jgi:hypothetical protein
MVACSDFTKENGGTLVIPGSHKWDDERPPLKEEAVSTVMKKGSALIWIGSVYHAGGQNTTNTYRTGLKMAYDLSNLRQEENMMLSVPLATIRKLPENIQKHLGWSSGGKSFPDRFLLAGYSVCSRRPLENYMGYVVVDGQFTNPMKLLEKKDFETLDNGVPAKL